MAEFVDSGDQAEMVYRSCRLRGVIKTKGGNKPRRVPIKGNPNISAPWKLSQLEQSKAGGDGLLLLHVNTMHWTSWLLGQLGVKQGEEGMEQDSSADHDTPSAGPNTPAAEPATTTTTPADANHQAKPDASSIQPRVYFPKDTDDATLAHYTNEVLERVVVRGVRRLQWRLRDAHAPNHYCDAGRYALAGADMRGVRNVGGKTSTAGPATSPGNANQNAQTASSTPTPARTAPPPPTAAHAAYLLNRN
jgi:hypothetical protein